MPENFFRPNPMVMDAEAAALEFLESLGEDPVGAESTVPLRPGPWGGGWEDWEDNVGEGRENILQVGVVDGRGGVMDRTGMSYFDDKEVVQL